MGGIIEPPEPRQYLYYIYVPGIEAIHVLRHSHIDNDNATYHLFEKKKHNLN